MCPINKAVTLAASGLELLGKATELAYEINKQIALKDAGDELADYATKQAAAIKSIDAVAATLEEDDEEIKEKVAHVKATNLIFNPPHVIIL